MAPRSVRALHASDFALDQPLAGFTDVPERLENLLLDLPYQAVSRVVDAAIAERVDIALLSGNLLDPTMAGPRGVTFLAEQFERLAQADIDVFWAGGENDTPDRWPSAAKLPPCVRHFPADRVTTHVWRGEGVEPLSITGRSGKFATLLPDAFRTTETGIPIVLACGEVDAEAAKKHNARYWALGGKRERRTVPAGQAILHHPGSPLGMSPEERSPRGCSIVEIPLVGAPRMKTIDLDPVRWRDETLEVETDATKDDLLRELREVMRTIAKANADRLAVVRWKIEGAKYLGSQARRGGLAEELLTILRDEFGSRSSNPHSPGVWTASLRLEADSDYPDDWYEEDTILGDYLRSVKKRKGLRVPFDWSRYLPLEGAPDLLANLPPLPDEARRQEILDEATALAVDLLRGDKPYVVAKNELKDKPAATAAKPALAKNEEAEFVGPPVATGAKS